MNITFRDAKPEDAQQCGTICFEAFRDLANRHNFPPDFPTPEVAIGLIEMLINGPRFYGVVAELDGEIVGSNFLDERGEVVGLGPITVNVTGQNQGVGRLLMEHCINRTQERGIQALRLLQAAYHNRSLSLYTKLGFEVQDILSTMQGSAIKQSVAGYSVRPAGEQDIEACNFLCRQTHNHTRQGELQDGIAAGSARVVEQDGAIRGYTSLLGFFGHTVTADNDALKALIGEALEFQGPGFLLPSGNGEVMRWCLENGLKVVKQLTLMTTGEFQHPTTPYMPSILY